MASRPVVFDVTHRLPLAAHPGACWRQPTYVCPHVRLERLALRSLRCEGQRSGTGIRPDAVPEVARLGDRDRPVPADRKRGAARQVCCLLAKPTGPLAANRHRAIAQGLHLLRPMDVMREAAATPDRISRRGSGRLASRAPFASSDPTVKTDYGAFGLPNRHRFLPGTPRSPSCASYGMAKWYADKGQFVHALSLVREWLPSLLCCHFEIDPS